MTESSPPLIGNISDTARWVAAYRARETQRAGGLFKDPFAKLLAGPRGEEIASQMPSGSRHEWAFPVRTYLFDRFITEQIRQGADMVINLAAGLDARPYRMRLPSTLQWIEVDLPELIAYKEDVLRAVTPACSLERVRLNLSDSASRRDLFRQLTGRCRKAMVITEGLLIYLPENDVAALAEDLSAHGTFQRWVLDMASPGLLRLIRRDWGHQLIEANAPVRFGPAEGPLFFERYGWRRTDVRSLLKTASKFKRVPWYYRLTTIIPESTGRQNSRPWSGVCLLSNATAANGFFNPNREP